MGRQSASSRCCNLLPPAPCPLPLPPENLLSPPFRRLARDAAAIAAAAAVGELLEREAVGHELTFELRLTRRAGRAVFELERRLGVAWAVDEEARAPFRRRGADQSHRFGATREQPDCFNEPRNQGGQSTRG